MSKLSYAQKYISHKKIRHTKELRCRVSQEISKLIIYSPKILEESKKWPLWPSKKLKVFLKAVRLISKWDILTP